MNSFCEFIKIPEIYHEAMPESDFGTKKIGLTKSPLVRLHCSMAFLSRRSEIMSLTNCLSEGFSGMGLWWELEGFLHKITSQAEIICINFGSLVNLYHSVLKCFNLPLTGSSGLGISGNKWITLVFCDCEEFTSWVVFGLGPLSSERGLLNTAAPGHTSAVGAGRESWRLEVALGAMQVRSTWVMVLVGNHGNCWSSVTCLAVFSLGLKNWSNLSYVSLWLFLDESFLMSSCAGP